MIKISLIFLSFGQSWVFILGFFCGGIWESMAGGRRGTGRGRGRGKSNNNNESKNRRRKGSGPSYSSAGKGALFVEGGLLSDWSSTPTPRG